jgi:hypothetical protein
MAVDAYKASEDYQGPRSVLLAPGQSDPLAVEVKKQKTLMITKADIEQGLPP